MSTIIPNPATTDWVPMGFGLGGPIPTQPSVRVFSSVAQSIPNNAFTSVTFDTARWDVGPSVHWSAATSTRLTCQVAGTYAITGHLTFAAAAGGTQRYAVLLLNGATYIGNSGVTGATVVTGPTVRNSVTSVYRLNVGDYVELQAFQDSGAALNVNASTATTNQSSIDFEMTLVGGVPGPPGTAGVGVPVPVVNGQWIKGSGGAAVWSPIAQSDLPTNLGPTSQTVTDWNAITATGYYIATNATNQPAGGATQFYGYCQVWTAGYQTQTLTELANAAVPRTYRRQQINNTWTAWSLLTQPVQLLHGWQHYGVIADGGSHWHGDTPSAGSWTAGGWDANMWGAGNYFTQYRWLGYMYADTIPGATTDWSVQVTACRPYADNWPGFWQGPVVHFGTSHGGIYDSGWIIAGLPAAANATIAAMYLINYAGAGPTGIHFGLSLWAR